MRVILGVDEVGRGPLAGPVVAACCGLEHTGVRGLRDSKRLSKQKRSILDGEIRSIAHVGLGVASVDEIDALNILQASLLAMRRAVRDYLNQNALTVDDVECLLLDGNQVCGMDGMNEYALVGGDDAIPQIQAASIIAKVARDKRMYSIAQLYRGYGFERHMGYGTAQHLEALQKLGVCPAHRRSFRPVAERLSMQEIRSDEIITSSGAGGFWRGG